MRKDRNQKKEMMYFFTIDTASQKINFIQLNLISGETTKSEQEFIQHEAKLLNEERTYEMKEVGAVIFAENKTKKTLEIEQHYVGLVKWDEDEYCFYISFSKVSDLNKELFTIKTKTECTSISQYVNLKG